MNEKRSTHSPSAIEARRTVKRISHWWYAAVPEGAIRGDRKGDSSMTFGVRGDE